jgi:hypothetical protein
MQLIQIGETKVPQTVTIQQMFEQLAQKEAQMIREARERVSKQIRTNG